MNSVYDPDPAIGGGTLAGFTQLAAIYNIYQVIRFRFRYEVANLETTEPVQFGFTMKDYQPSTVATTYALAQDLLEVAPTTGPHTCGVLAGNSTYKSRWFSIHPGAVVGNNLLYMSTAGYSSAINTNPSSIVWNSFVLMAEGPGATLPNGVILNLYMEFTTRFYSLSSTIL